MRDQAEQRGVLFSNHLYLGSKRAPPLPPIPYHTTLASLMIPYSYKFSRVLIFAHFVCAKIGNFRADLFSRTSRFSNFKNLRYGNRNEKQEHFCENFNWDLFLCAKLKKFGTNFRAISRKSRFCAKMREN